MDSKKRILIIGFEKKNNIRYPHLKDVVDFFKFKCNADYLHFRERGYFLGSSSKTKANIGYFASIIISILDLLKFLYKNLHNNYEKIIIIDNFTYIVVSLFSKKTVLWSHDFVTNDQPHKTSFFQKIISKGTNHFLKKRKKIIIQDKSRFNIFCDSYNINSNTLNVFYLPVSGHPIMNNNSTKVTKIPKLLQIGGINQHRSYSYDLVTQYQNNSQNYELYLHGYFDEYVKQKIPYEKNMPFCSTFELDGDKVYKIVEKCDVGFIAYKSDNLNFYYISFASGQLVEFLKLGKPVIVFGNTDLVNLVAKYNIGIAIEKIADLDSAIEYITLHYMELTYNCKKLFNDKYNINNYLEKLYSWL